MFNRTRRKQSGMTLIEALIVACILGVILSICGTTCSQMHRAQGGQTWTSEH